MPAQETDESHQNDGSEHPPRIEELSASVAIMKGTFYKGTKLGRDIVVQRGISLFSNRIETYHIRTDKPNDVTVWQLDRHCQLVPASSEELSRTTRGIRPKGKWAITSAIQGVESSVNLYEFVIDWPAAWAAVGYTALHLGFEDRGTAEAWHAAVVGALQRLRTAKHSRHSSTKTTIDLGATSMPMTLSAPRSMSVSDASDLASVSRRASSAVAQAGPGTSAPTSTVTSQPTSAPVSRQSSVKPQLQVTVFQTAEPALPLDDEEDWTDPESDPDELDDLDEETPTPDDQRWVPYRHTNGVAVYYHPTEDKKGGPGEYMVSGVVRGRPARVAAALLSLRGNNTLLGPAAHVEVLKGDENKQVLRLVLTATGHAGFFCAPREVILEYIRKEEDDGVVVIMFKSVDHPSPESSGSPDSGLYGSGLYRRPVRCTVAGGYTIAGLRGAGAASPESLVTAIVSVDLKGSFCTGNRVRPMCELAGWADSFLDRILMSLHLLRDTMEQRRFSVKPFQMVGSAKARFDEDGAITGDREVVAMAQRAAAVSPGPPGPAPLPTPGRALLMAPPARMQSMRLDAATVAAAVELLSLNRGSEGGGGGGKEQTIHEEEREAEADEHPEAPAASLAGRLDLAHVQSLALMPRHYWTELHLRGTDAPFCVRGATYLKDKKKVPAGAPMFSLGAMNLVVQPPGGPMEHIARFIPAVRSGGAPFSVVVHLVIPGSPQLGLVAVFACDKHPSILGAPPKRPMEQRHDWQPFDFVLHKFVNGNDEARDRMLKLIPHIASGSWMIKQSVGTTPVILGKALKTSYHVTDRYIEVDIDISANSVANYVTGMVRGATTGLVIDMGFVLEGTEPWELPEGLLGCMRLTKLDCNKASTQMDYSNELPMAPVRQ